MLGKVCVRVDYVIVSYYPCECLIDGPGEENAIIWIANGECEHLASCTDTIAEDKE